MTRIATVLAVFLTFFMFTDMNAQFPSGGAAGGKMPSIGRLYGKLVDAKTKEPVEFASVALFLFGKDSAIAGVLTKQNGDFSLDNLPVGGFKLRIQFLGYKTIEQKIFINFAKLEQDLGDIKLEPDETLLQEATVVAEKSTVSLSIDKRVYNVDKDLSVKGGTALDAMKNVPGVSLDADGNATLRNSTPQIYIDGRPTTLTLQQIPSDQIERIEVITNPSVKFEAATSGGILNLVMKKNSKPGYNGIIMGGIGNVDRYNGMVNLNIKENPWNISLMYNYNTATNLTNGYTNRTNLYNGSVLNYYNQDNNTRGQNTFQMGRLGIDYQINNRNSLSFAQMGMLGAFRTNDKQTYEFLSPNSTGYAKGTQTNISNAGFYNLNSQLIYKRTFPKPGKEFTIDGSFNYNAGENNYLYSMYDNYYIANAENTSYQKNDGESSGSMYTFQMDYVNPLTDTSKIEWGIRSNIKQTFQKNVTQNSNAFNNYMFQRDTFMSNNYAIDDIVNGAYVNYSNKTGKFGYQAGLRFEQSYYSGRILDKDSSFSYSYPSKPDNILKSLFPGIYFSRKFKNNQEWQINFSRKIERPNFFQLMPFVMFADKQNYRIGNPQLTPEFRNVAETNYNKILSKGSFLSSLYFRYIETPITNVAYPKATDSTVLINTFVNGASSFNYGWENNIKYTLFKNFDATLNVNVLYISLKSTSQFGNTTTEGFTWNTKGTFTYKLPKDFTLQLNGNYEAPRVVINGETKPMYFLDFSASKMIKRKIIINASVSDIFNTKRMGTVLSAPTYEQSLMRRREARFFKLNVTFMFGKMDASIFKKRKGPTNSMGGNQDGLDF
ncbi:MAG TPA: outer membrane beta-barrel family protein [Bacteroidia bacterium]